jgi:hypothetical protein
MLSRLDLLGCEILTIEQALSPPGKLNLPGLISFRLAGAAVHAFLLRVGTLWLFPAVICRKPAVHRHARACRAGRAACLFAAARWR